MSQSAEEALARIDALVGFNRTEDAYAEAVKATTQFPDDEVLFTRLARINVVRRDFPAAKEAAERALAINPDSALGMFNLVPALLFAERRAEAREVADRMVEMYPEWASGLLQRAFIYSRAEKVRPDNYHEVVVTMANRAVELTPEDAGNITDAAEYLANVGDGRRAGELYRRALELDPTNEDILLRATYALQDEAAIVDVSLGILSNNPQAVDASYELHTRMWKRIVGTVSVTAGLAGTLAVFAYLFFSDENLTWVRITVTALVAITIPLWLRFALRTREIFPTSIILRALRETPLVIPALIVTGLTTLATLASFVVLLVTPFGEYYGKDPLFVTVILVLAIIVIVQSLATIAIAWSVAHVEVRDGRYPDSPYGRMALKYRLAGRGSAGLGIFGGFILMFLAVVVRYPGAGMAIWAIAATCAACSFASFGVTAQLRAAISRHLWIPPIWYLIATGFFALAIWLIVEQIGSLQTL